MVHTGGRQLKRKANQVVAGIKKRRKPLKIFLVEIMLVHPWTPAYNRPRVLRALTGPFQSGGGIVVRRPQYSRKRRGTIIGPFPTQIRPRIPGRYKKSRIA